MVRFPESEGALEPRITGTGDEIKTPVEEAAEQQRKARRKV
jgi:hypothetical protein